MKRFSFQWPEALSAMRHRNYRLYWFGQVVSISGSFMQVTAQQWLVYKLTGSALALGTVTFVNTLPSLLLSLWAGVLVDRMDKRRLLIILQWVMMGLALTLAGLTYTGLITFPLVLVLTALLGVATTFDLPARHAFTVEMTSKDDLNSAVAMNSSMFNLARLVGPAVGGVVVGQVGEAAAFGLNALSFLAVIVGLQLMRLPPFTPRPQTTRALDDLKEGLLFIRQTPTVLMLVFTVVAPGLFGFSLQSLIPLMAGDVLGLPAEGYGVLVSAIGLGALIGAITLALVGRGHKGALLSVAMLVGAGGGVVFGASTWMPLSFAALMAVGWGMVTHLASANTLLQLLTPDHLRGRVLAAFLWVVVGAGPVGALIMGGLAEALSAPWAIVLGSGMSLLGGVLVQWRMPALRQLK